MKLKKFGSILIVMLMLATLMVGCGKKDEVDKPEDNTSKQDTDSSESKETVTLSFIHNLDPEVEAGGAAALRNAIEELKVSHPEIIIKEEVLSHDGYDKKIKALAAGNEMPDLFQVKGSMVDTFISNGIISDINADLDADPEWKDGFLTGSFAAFTRDSKIYAVPQSSKSTSVVFYNESIFNEVGIKEFPKTWDEFTSAIKALKDAGYTPISLGNKGKWVAESCILSTLGDRFTGVEWFESIKNHDGAKFTDPEFVSALTTFQELAKMGAFNTDMNSIDNMQQKTPYYNGKAAMFIEGAWAISSIETDAPEEIKNSTKLTILPTVNDGKGEAMAMSGGASWAFDLNANLTGAKREAAITVLKALSNETYGAILAENNSNPAVKAGPYDESKLTRLFKEYNALVDNCIYTPVYDAQLSTSVIEVMNSGIQELLIDMTTPEELAKKIQTEYEKESN
ncbi:putative ABC transporter extracellular-binding protein YurO [Vallitalea longa]|uniref:ABC transporter extracellular-binding protein YurO n=1 Tax=Vallitalea longa TaxID=2936439 RepID=A0A9W5YE32_9FIRM|nr:extracellular solute-binding protein [Vallitalea longa]GKX32257.1 putative ABC transporter extracellular-binding protein YurO [Vallitalea longa]